MRKSLWREPNGGARGDEDARRKRPGALAAESRLPRRTALAVESIRSQCARLVLRVGGFLPLRGGCAANPQDGRAGSGSTCGGGPRTHRTQQDRRGLWGNGGNRGCRSVERGGCAFPP